MDIILSLFSPESKTFLLLLAFFLGIFVGLRREMLNQKHGYAGLVGMRTMAMVVAMGALLTFFPAFPYLPVIGLLLLAGFLFMAYWNGATNMGLVGLTAEFMTIMMYLVGVLVGYGEVMLAVILTIIVGSLSTFKSELHDFAGTISKKEWIGVLEILIITAVVLPLLPTDPIDPWGIWVPSEIWLIVIAISGISFVGYVIHKYFGGKRSILFSAFIGALVSSTATTIHFANLAKKELSKQKHQLYMAALLLAVTTMFVRIIVIILILGGIANPELVVAPVVMGIVSGLAALWLVRKIPDTVIKKESPTKNPDYHSPFDIIPALIFGALFSVILFAVAITESLFGSAGVIATTIIASTVDVDAITLSVLESHDTGTTVLFVSALALMIASIINTLIKAFYVWTFSRQAKFSQELLVWLSVISISGVIAFVLVFTL